MNDESYRHRNSIAMDAIMNYKDNDETIRQQQKLRKAIKINGKLNQERIECIRKSNSQLRLKFIETNDFIRACSEKEEIAKRNIADKNERKKCLNQQIEDLEKKIENLERFYEKFTNSINGLKSFERALDEVVVKMELCREKTKEDFIDRCDSLCMSFIPYSSLLLFNLLCYSIRSDDGKCKQ